MVILVPIQALFILHTLQQAGFEAYIVGGAVRDMLLQAENATELDPATVTNPSWDFDFTTNALPEQIQVLFPEHFYENTFGTVSVTHEDLNTQMGLPEFETTDAPISNPDRQRIIDVAQATKVHISLAAPDADDTTSTQTTVPHYQITTFRSDEVYDDFRRPTSMNWGKSLAEDLERRDFTINALAIKVPGDVLLTRLTQTTHDPKHRMHSLESSEYELIDQHGGLQDLRAGLIKTVGEPEQRFQEDALRMLRAVRFSVQLNMGIDTSTFEAMTVHAALLQHISGERIRDEFLKMLSSAYPAEAVELLDESGLLKFILPELLAGKGVQQGGHHTTDVWTHSIDALRWCPSDDPIVRLATLVHDIDKPETYQEQKGTITFYNHEVQGARTAKRIAQRLRLSKRDTDRLFTLVRHHMFHYQPTMTDAAIRRFMRKVGLENIDDILDLREGDRLGSGARKTSWRLEEMKQRMIEQLNQPLDVTDLAINGHDLMETLKLKPGRVIGYVLQELFEQVMDNPELNTKEKLLELAGPLVEKFTNLRN